MCYLPVRIVERSRLNDGQWLENRHLQLHRARLCIPSAQQPKQMSEIELKLIEKLGD